MRKMIARNEKCIKDQAEQYALLGKQDQQLRKFRHDYNAHVMAMQEYEEAGEYEKLAAYVKTLSAQAAGSKVFCTGNLICDAILNRYHDLCTAQGINFTVTGKISEKLLISEVDLCVILSNGISNAYEAAERCEEKREIEVDFLTARTGAYMFITIKNTTAEPISFADGLPATSKLDKVNHGLGVQNMKETAEKNGFVAWGSIQDNEVITKIAIKIEQN
jgi:sensor histidine kinase regulating citrate/malate metabolism